MKNSIHNYKLIKVAELSVFFVLEIVFLIILISNKTMRSSVFVDKSLFVLCAIAYLTVMVSLLFLLYDFVKLKELKKECHELENLAYLDEKTGIPNRTSCDMLFATYSTPESMNGIGCVLTEISNIKEINTANGKAVGDKVINDFTHLFEAASEGYGFVGRNGGNEFVTVIEACDAAKMRSYHNALLSAVDKYNKSNPNSSILIHSEYVLYDYEEAGSFSELLSKAYDKLRSN